MFDFLITLTARLFLKSPISRRRILVVQEGKIGDLVCTTPLFRMLKNNFAEPVDIVAGPFAAEILKGNDAVGKIWPRTVSSQILRQEQYSHALILMPSVEMLRSCVGASILNLFGTTHDKITKKEKLYSIFLTQKFHYDFTTAAQEHYLKMARALGAINEAGKREVYFDAQDRTAAEQYLQQNGLQGKKLAGISVTAGKDFKEWGAGNFTQLINRLNEAGYLVVGVGSGPERQKLEDLVLKVDSGMFFNAAGLFSLSQLAALITNFSVFVSADTGPLYIADALGVPVVDLMGPCCSTSQRPQGAKAVIVGECREPAHPKCYMMNCPNALREDFSRCMRDITFAEVWKGLEYVH